MKMPECVHHVLFDSDCEMCSKLKSIDIDIAVVKARLTHLYRSNVFTGDWQVYKEMRAEYQRLNLKRQEYL